MKTIGLIGGMSWESTVPYYRIINETVRERLGVILGCTEISMLVGPSDSPVPLFDTTAIHARKAAECALT